MKKNSRLNNLNVILITLVLQWHFKLFSLKFFQKKFNHLMYFHILLCALGKLELIYKISNLRIKNEFYILL